MKKNFWVLSGLFIGMILWGSSVYAEEEIVVKEGDFWIGCALPRITSQGKEYPLVNASTWDEPTETRRGEAGFFIEQKRDPELHKEFKLCHTEYKWTAGSLKVEPDDGPSATVKLGKSDWGTIHNVTANVKWLAYKDSDKNPHAHQQVFEKTRDSEFIAPEIKLKTLAFNHKVGSLSDDGLDIRESYAGANIDAPEYTANGRMNGRTKPAAYKMGIRATIQGEFEILPGEVEVADVFAFEQSGFIGTLSLTKVFANPGSARFTSEKEIASKIDHDTQSWKWTATRFHDIGISGWECVDLTTHPDIFSILDAPYTPWKQEPYYLEPWTGESAGNQRPWVDALKFAIDTCQTKGLSTKDTALSVITGYLFSNHGLKYDTKEGNSSYMDILSNTSGNLSLDAMNLTGYIQRANEVVNCYDQAGGVSSLGSLLGVTVNFEFKQPFGFITPTDLVGIPGKCNNPFFMRNQTPQLVPMNSPYRTYFGNHAYTDFNGNVYDACGGPVQGINKSQYFGNTIDQSRPIFLPPKFLNAPIPSVK